jgi:hypothetical protein
MVVMHAGLFGSRLLACPKHAEKIGSDGDINKILPLTLKEVKDAFQKQGPNALSIQSASQDRKEVAIGVPPNRGQPSSAQSKAQGLPEPQVKLISDKEAEALFSERV